MAVFICAADESKDENPKGNFFYGGFSAPLDDWERLFAPAWEERVLKGPPRIPYFHTAEMCSPHGRAQYGINALDADARLTQASQVIKSTGRLVPVVFGLDETDYDTLVRQKFLVRPGHQDVLVPDYITFLFFAYAQLLCLADGTMGEVEKVDFWVERNGKISRNLTYFHQNLADGLIALGHGDWVPLIGEIQEVHKERVPAQAADMLVWHARRAEREELDRHELKRYWRMVDSGYGFKGRHGLHKMVQREDLEALATAFATSIIASASDEAAAEA